MNLFKRFLFISFFLSTMQLGAMAPIENTSSRQLNEQMKSFRHRVHIYLKCLPGVNKCTPEERMAAGKVILKDGAILFGALIVAGTGLFLSKKYAWPRWKEYSYERTKSAYLKAQADYLKAKGKDADAAFDKWSDLEKILNEKRKDMPLGYFKQQK